MKKAVTSRYQDLLNTGAIDDDEAQRAIIKHLDTLLIQLNNYEPLSAEKKLIWPLRKKAPEKSKFIKGLYLWGPVGRGKTLLMDLFFDELSAKRKKRVHFNEFMIDVHERVHQWRLQSKAGTTRYQEPITPIADALITEASVLCFDEFSVTDIADAMIVGRLFTALFERGLVMICTSNVPPSNLYENGLNRSLFLPFIEELKKRLTILNLLAKTDFRLEKIAGTPVFYTPCDRKAKEALDTVFKKITGHRQGQPLSLKIKGHELRISEMSEGVARLSFGDLCAKALGANDYIILAKRFHTIILDNVPKMEFDQRNEAKRFIMLVDALYNAKTKLVMSAETEVNDLYFSPTGVEVFEFDRTVSRLIEMRSLEYLNAPHSPPDN